ncbi:hypothetical protein P171DRAFT_450099 [Karstenula rhodostoma CBS 690.94]|uniref:F-box domain-containing protein n=1 Tax=Karstenula rhodostoma CBS 690.94 TaxID=1392251 RepID=A0A9P4U528_9PLEO|nr:hypothetical protein P171DRAFT_450099 [Karstenula rhodostoma CBS 690.94]
MPCVLHELIDQGYFEECIDGRIDEHIVYRTDYMNECKNERTTSRLCGSIPRRDIRNYVQFLSHDQDAIEEKERWAALEEEHELREYGIGGDDLDASLDWAYSKEGLALHSMETLDPRRLLTYSPARLGPVWTGSQDTDPYQLRAVDITYLENHIKAGLCGNNRECLFFKLPLEIRNMIYGLALPESIKVTHRRQVTCISRCYNNEDFWVSHAIGKIGLPFWMLASKQILLETLLALRFLSKFYIPARISGPLKRRCKNNLMGSILEHTRLKVVTRSDLRSTAADPITLDHYEQKPYMLLVEVKFGSTQKDCSQSLGLVCYAKSWDEWKGGDFVREPAEYVHGRYREPQNFPQWVRLTVRGPPDAQSRRAMTEILDTGIAMAEKIYNVEEPHPDMDLNVFLTETRKEVHLSEKKDIPAQFLFMDREEHETPATDRPECFEISTRVVRTDRDCWCSYRGSGLNNVHFCEQTWPGWFDSIEWEWERVLSDKCACDDKTRCLVCNDDRCVPCKWDRKQYCGEKKSIGYNDFGRYLGAYTLERCTGHHYCILDDNCQLMQRCLRWDKSGSQSRRVGMGKDCEECLVTRTPTRGMCPTCFEKNCVRYGDRYRQRYGPNASTYVSPESSEDEGYI